MFTTGMTASTDENGKKRNDVVSAVYGTMMKRTTGNCGQPATFASNGKYKMISTIEKTDALCYTKR